MEAWKAQAECTLPHSRCTPDDFFYEERFPADSPDLRVHLEFLANICAECRVFEKCRTFVDHYRIDVGFWAGETGQQRLNRWRGKVQCVAPPPIRKAAKD